MTKFYSLDWPRHSRYTGRITATHKWRLPGVHCPKCETTWAGSATAFPNVDLSSHPEEKEFKEARPEPLEQFERLRELVRPLVPPGAQLLPGAKLGPLVGTALGTFSQIFLYDPDMPLIQRKALEQLQAEGIRGLKGFPTELRFRQKNHPELLELEILPQGRLHPSCTPERPPPCRRCGRDSFMLPDELILDAASLPADTDLFRLTDFETVFIGTERFVETVRRLNLEEVDIRELPVR
ncbi:double-CXXCG motif protein [Archangium lansingense]|uniref:SitI6 family double-CXXCG motif immunity protein n=1 Tax=Archangium lansingense TaxID=2995310 RepID=UPI003B8061F4